MCQSKMSFNMNSSVIAVMVLFCCVIAKVTTCECDPPNDLQDLSKKTQSRDWVQVYEDYIKNYWMNKDWRPQPAFNAERDVIFRLYTTRSLNNPEIIQINNLTSVIKSFWNPSKPTRFIIHGALGYCESPINILLREAYLAVGEFNVVTVDWGKGANWYGENENKQLTFNSKLVSALIARFIDWMNINKFLEFNQISILGHSIGAQMAGITGKLVTRGQIHTIVGLELGLGPNKNVGPDERLDATDAEYVEVIHTNIGVLGIGAPIGTADFYPNGGLVQHGCDKAIFSGCEHNIVLAYMAESINPVSKRFTSIQCGSYNEILHNNCTSTGVTKVNMGGEPSNHDVARGVYYLTTNNESPYARGSNT